MSNFALGIYAQCMDLCSMSSGVSSEGGCSGGTRVLYTSIPGNVTLIFPSGNPPPSLMTVLGCSHHAWGAAGGEGSGRGAGGRVPTTPPLPRGAIFKSIFSCLIQLLQSQQTEHGRNIPHFPSPAGFGHRGKKDPAWHPSYTFTEPQIHPKYSLTQCWAPVHVCAHVCCPSQQLMGCWR